MYCLLHSIYNRSQRRPLVLLQWFFIGLHWIPCLLPNQEHQIYPSICATSLAPAIFQSTLEVLAILSLLCSSSSLLLYFQSAVGSDRRLQLELINLLIDYLDLDAAVDWALYFQLPVESVPHQIASQLQSRQLYDRRHWFSASISYQHVIALYHQVKMPAQCRHDMRPST